MEEDNDSWGDLFTEYPIASSLQAEELVSILDEAKIDNFKLSVSFPAEYQQLEFNNELKMQTEGSQQSSSQSYYRKSRTFLKKPEGYPKYVTMELGRDEIRSKIFVQVYREEINRIEVENNYRIFADRKKVLIYMKEGCDLNSLIKNKLFELHQQLCVYQSTDQGLIVKMSKSSKLRDDLQKYGITAWFRWYRRIEMGYFFSTKMDLKEIERTVGEVARFSVSLFNLQSQYLSPIENESIFLLIREAITEQVQVLEQEYEVDVQFSEEHKCLVVHKKHPCFGREVEATLQLMLDELLIISVKSKEIRQFNNLIRKEFKHLSFVRERMKNSRNETFLVIGKSEMMDKDRDSLKMNQGRDSLKMNQGRVSLKYLEAFLKYFKMLVDSQLQLKVFFNHIDQAGRKQEVERVLQLAEDHNFILQNQELAERFTTKGAWKIRDLSEVILPKRQRELISFIKGLITRDEQEDNPKEIESMYDSFFQEDSSASIASIKGEMSAEQKSKIEVKGRLEWFREEFTRPKMRDIEEEDKPFILGRRRRDLEKVFEENSRAKFKIWGLQLSSRVEWPAEVEQWPVLIRRAFVKGCFNDRFESLNPHSLSISEQGLVVYMNKHVELNFVPVLQLQRIG